MEINEDISIINKFIEKYPEKISASYDKSENSFTVKLNFAGCIGFKEIYDLKKAILDGTYIKADDYESVKLSGTKLTIKYSSLGVSNIFSNNDEFIRTTKHTYGKIIINKANVCLVEDHDNVEYFKQLYDETGNEDCIDNINSRIVKEIDDDEIEKIKTYDEEHDELFYNGKKLKFKVPKYFRRLNKNKTKKVISGSNSKTATLEITVGSGYYISTISSYEFIDALKSTNDTPYEMYGGWKVSCIDNNFPLDENDVFWKTHTPYSIIRDCTYYILGMLTTGLTSSKNDGYEGFAFMFSPLSHEENIGKKFKVVINFA